MKKIITFCSLLLVFLSPLLAQTSGGPDSYGYTWRNSNDGAGAPVYSWIDITGLPGAVHVSGLADDNSFGPVLMPFSFHYYWYNVNKFWIGSNGYLIFMNGQIASPFVGIPATGSPNDFVAPFMCDLNFAGTGNPANCWYWMNAANDTLIVSWITVPFWMVTAPTWTGANTFQVILSAVDSSITYNYKQQTGTYQPATNYLSVGIENNSGSMGLQNYHDPVAPYVPINFSIKYYFPASTAFTVNDASTIWGDNADKGARFMCKNGNPYTMTSEVKNVGNLSLAAFNVDSKVIGPAPAVNVRAQDTHVTGALAPAQVESITMNNTFNPTFPAGTYTYYTVTKSPGDVFPGNDTANVEIQVVDSTQHTILLSYDNGAYTATPPGLSWQGGDGGAGIYIVPPYYPCEITDLRYFIASNPTLSGFVGQILDDDGPGGTPQTVLFADSLLNVTDTLTWDTIAVIPPVTITSGGFYVSWMMRGNGIVLGHDQIPPISNRTFEVLGSSWAIYRYRETEDLMINAIMTGNFGAGISDASAKNYVSEIFPNPAAYKVNLNFRDLPDGKAEVEIYDIQGTKLISQPISGFGSSAPTLTLDISSLSSGIYFCRVKTGDGISQSKFAVMR